MNAYGIEEEVIVHPVDGMQLSEGYIRRDEIRCYRGRLLGMEPSFGTTIEEVLACLQSQARNYYGDDVIVELSHHAA